MPSIEEHEATWPKMWEATQFWLNLRTPLGPVQMEVRKGPYSPTQQQWTWRIRDEYAQIDSGSAKSPGEAKRRARNRLALFLDEYKKNNECEQRSSTDAPT